MKSEYSDIPPSLRKRVFKLLGKYPTLKPKDICIQLGEDYKAHGEVITQYKKQWKKEYKSEHGLIRSFPDSVHNVFFKGKLPLELVQDMLTRLRLGLSMWRVSRSRNRFWLFRDRVNGRDRKLGRIRLFENGTVELFVPKPASLGKAMQLFCEGFTKTNLIDSIKVVEEFQHGLVRRMHSVFDAGQRLPYMKVTAFEDTHKFTFVSGDKSDPTCYEFMVEYHAEVERARSILEQLFSLSQGMNGVKPLDRDYST